MEIIKKGGHLTDECKQVSHLQFSMLTGTDNILGENLDEELVKNKLPIADRKSDYTDKFIDNNLTVCDSDNPLTSGFDQTFCKKGKILRINLHKFIPGDDGGGGDGPCSSSIYLKLFFFNGSFQLPVDFRNHTIVTCQLIGSNRTGDFPIDTKSSSTDVLPSIWGAATVSGNIIGGAGNITITMGNGSTQSGSFTVPKVSSGPTKGCFNVAVLNGQHDTKTIHFTTSTPPIIAYTQTVKWSFTDLCTPSDTHSP